MMTLFVLLRLHEDRFDELLAFGVTLMVFSDACFILIKNEE